MRRFALIFVCLFLASCRNEEEPVGRNDAIRYYLNQGDYDEAINLLKERLADDPEDDAAKILLASAYTGSIGINSIDCFEVLRPKLFDKPLNESSSALDSSAVARLLADAETEEPADDATKPQRQAIRAIEKELLRFASQSRDALEVAFRLPHVPVADRDRIVLSLALLSGIHEDSPEYLTAQLYVGILSFVQFMNYFRDAIPPRGVDQPEFSTWYLSVYCQLDLGVLLPNLSQSVDYLTAGFQSLANAGRKSDNPIYANLTDAKDRLVETNAVYLTNQDLFEFADWSHRASKASVCEEP